MQITVYLLTLLEHCRPSLVPKFGVAPGLGGLSFYVRTSRLVRGDHSIPWVQQACEPHPTGATGSTDLPAFVLAVVYI